MPSAFYLWRGSDSGRYDPFAWHGIVLAARPTDNGYILEMMIPWSNLTVDPFTGQRIGIALNVSDNDSVGTAVQEMMKSHVETRTYEAPATWGTLTLQE